jgi:hypothetical protein
VFFKTFPLSSIVSSRTPIISSFPYPRRAHCKSRRHHQSRTPPLEPRRSSRRVAQHRHGAAVGHFTGNPGPTTVPPADPFRQPRECSKLGLSPTRNSFSPSFLIFLGFLLIF